MEEDLAAFLGAYLTFPVLTWLGRGEILTIYAIYSMPAIWVFLCLPTFFWCLTFRFNARRRRRRTWVQKKEGGGYTCTIYVYTAT